METNKRTLSIWLVYVASLVMMLLLVVSITSTLYVSVSQRFLTIPFVIELAIRILVFLLLAITFVSIRHRRPAGRYLAPLVPLLLLCMHLMIVFYPEITQTGGGDWLAPSNRAEQGGAQIAKLIALPGLLLWWFVATLALKSRRYFESGHP